MTNNNDGKILALQELVKTKKDNLKTYKKAWMITNWLINIDIPFSDKAWVKNINTLTQLELVNLLVFLSLFQDKAKQLNLDISSFIPIDSIILDIEWKLKDNEYKNKKRELDLLQAKLDNMLSLDKKYELELDNISDLLKDL